MRGFCITLVLVSVCAWLGPDGGRNRVWLPAQLQSGATHRRYMVVGVCLRGARHFASLRCRPRSVSSAGVSSYTAVAIAHRAARPGIDKIGEQYPCHTNTQKFHTQNAARRSPVLLCPRTRKKRDFPDGRTRPTAPVRPNGELNYSTGPWWLCGCAQASWGCSGAVL